MSLHAQTIVTSTVDSRTIEYSYDSLGRLVKNFSIDKKVNIDSLKKGVPGEWLIIKYESWEKETIDSLPNIIEFINDSIFLKNGVLLDNTNDFSGSFNIIPNDAEGAEILIEQIVSTPKKYQKIKLFVIHYQSDVMFISVMTYANYSNTYKGLYKLNRIK